MSYCNGEIIRKCIGSASCSALLVCLAGFAYFSGGMPSVYSYAYVTLNEVTL